MSIVIVSPLASIRILNPAELLPMPPRVPFVNKWVSVVRLPVVRLPRLRFCGKGVAFGSSKPRENAKILQRKIR